MKAKEQFAVMLRVLGVLGIMYLIRSVIRHHDVDAIVWIIRAVCVAIGLYMIRGAPCLANFAYPEDPKPGA